MARRDDEELRALLDDLEGTLADLRAALDEDGEAGTRRSERRRGPPTPGDLLRVTEEYTIPTLVATLEATIRALELLREVIRLTTPGDRVERREQSRGIAGRGAVVGAERTLDRLRTALAETDLPQDPAARELVAEARSLSEEIERRLAATDRPQSRDRGTGIEVREEGDEGDEATEPNGGSENASEEGTVDIDVEAELDSIRDELDGDQAELDSIRDELDGDQDGPDGDQDET